MPENEKMPKNEIIINEDQYQKAKHQEEISSNITAPIAIEPKFKSIASENNNNNDDRHGSVGSEPNQNNKSTCFPNSGYLGMVIYFRNSSRSWYKYSSGIKNKMN